MNHSTDTFTITTDHPAVAEVLPPAAQAFLVQLHQRFEGRRQELLSARQERQAEIDGGQNLDFISETLSVRESDYQVAECPADLLDRRCEITGPCDRKMMINALNSGAKVFMADCEDAQSPSWANQLQGQLNLKDAVRGTIELYDEAKDKRYTLGDDPATLLVRTRGWHLPERHVEINGQQMSGSLFDAGLYLFHNAKERLARGSGPYFYLPKLEHYREARLWAEVFSFAEDYLDIPQGSVRVTMLIETIHAAYQMDELLYELRDYASGLNAGRWDYIFSCIKVHRNRDQVFPDRSQVGMTVPFMYAYTELLVQTCHKRGAHAIGGMAAFIPNRRDPEVTAAALQQVHTDKGREAGQGYDGSWVAHPDLVPVCTEEFSSVLGEQPHQKDKQRDDVAITAEQLCDFTVPDGQITQAGLDTNVKVGIQYLDAWLCGAGAVAIDNLMEDAATSEISRAQVWQWVHKGACTNDGEPITVERYHAARDRALTLLGEGYGRLAEAVHIMDQMITSPDFPTFLTLPAYDILD